MNIIVTNQISYVLANKIFTNETKVLKYKGDHKEVRQIPSYASGNILSSKMQSQMYSQGSFCFYSEPTVS